MTCIPAHYINVDYVIEQKQKLKKKRKEALEQPEVGGTG